VEFASTTIRITTIRIRKLAIDGEKTLQGIAELAY
jgi:hypothetical protein